MGQSGKVVGQQYLKALQAYLANTPKLPLGSDGTLNVSEIAEKSGVPRQSFYKNPHIKAALDEARQVRGIPEHVGPFVDTPSDRTVASAPPRQAQKALVLERRINRLEQQNAVLVAENAELRCHLKALRLQMGRDDMTIETGRRIPVPASHD